ncbi:MAG: hypothetical protein ACYTFV_15050 [Planctomycetota bacterium]|jgi:hypothetical protein
MSRPLLVSFVVAAVAAVAALWFSGAPSPERLARLAALDAHQLLDHDVWVDANAAAAEDGTPSVRLAEAILTGGHFTDHGDETATLTLGRVDVDVDATDDRAGLVATARRSIVLGLRKAGGLELLVLDGSGAAARGFIPWDAPNGRSLIPPVLAIVLAIATRRPLLSLLIGVTSGSILVAMRNAGDSATVSASPGQLIDGLVDVPTVYLWNRVVDSNDLYIVLFVVLMLAMVGNLVRNGGIRGLMDRVQTLAKSARSTQVATWLMGLAVFFDDYANTVLVGSTMRTLTDRFRVAREKLAYLVDSTAAPVAGLSIFSTWIAFEVSTFAAQLPTVPALTSDDGYAIFLQTLPFRFYCILTLLMVGLVALSGRDFGPGDP